MTEEKKEQQEGKKEDCPLCDISDETLQRLKESQNKKGGKDSEKNNGSSGN